MHHVPDATSPCSWKSGHALHWKTLLQRTFVAQDMTRAAQTVLRWVSSWERILHFDLRDSYEDVSVASSAMKDYLYTVHVYLIGEHKYATAQSL